MKQPTKAQRDKWDRDNLRAAKLILSEPERHSRVMIDWATRFMQRRAEERSGQKSLFGSSAASNDARLDGRA